MSEWKHCSSATPHLDRFTSGMKVWELQLNSLTPRKVSASVGGDGAVRAARLWHGETRMERQQQLHKERIAHPRCLLPRLDTPGVKRAPFTVSSFYTEAANTWVILTTAFFLITQWNKFAYLNRTLLHINREHQGIDIFMMVSRFFPHRP